METIPVAMLAAVATLGVFSHVGWFIHGEHDFHGGSYLVLWASIQAIGLLVLTRFGDLAMVPAFRALVQLSATYLAALSTSILVYRALFHPLRSFPGPTMWKLSKWAHVMANLDAHGWKHLQRLHEEYGDFVRTGPNEISIIHPDAPDIVLGPGSKCTKSAWYGLPYPLRSMHQERTKEIHDVRRRVWDRAFNAKALRDYDPRVLSHAEVLFKQIAAFGGEPFNASKWFNFYSFDVMGDLAFGKSFDMLTKGEAHFAIKLLQESQGGLTFATILPWLFWILKKVPGATEHIKRFIRYSENQVKERQKMKPEQPDIMHWLLNAPPMRQDYGDNQNWLVGDARLIIVAGSDTTATALDFATYELLRHPDYISKLQREVEPLLANGVDQTKLQKAELLNSIINETLRLHPPVPSVMMRIAPPEGIVIGGTVIPGGTILNLPAYSLQRSSKAFERPEAFVPERWTSSPELIKNKQAYIPFSVGPFGCIGKNLALMEIRAVLSQLVHRFDISFAPGEDGRALVEDTKEHFTLGLADMKICCKLRKNIIHDS